jgi:prepilin-type N-terminal cleavage/methylation domain-containing protein
VNQYLEDRKEQGFTLIELLIAIVVVGILAAVAIVGIAGLTNTGSKSACTQTMDSAKAASAAFYANNLQDPAGAGSRATTPWPTSIQEMTVSSASHPTNAPPVYEAPTGAAFPDASHMTVGSWTLHMGGGGASPVTFDCP